jgi:uncharacterized protein with GYD domain
MGAALEPLRGGISVPKYLIKASYSRGGAASVLQAGGSARVTAVKHAMESAGGKLESFYFAFGGTDAYVTIDLPDNETAAALALAVNSTDGASVETVVLLTAEEMDAAANKKIDFTPAAG